MNIDLTNVLIKSRGFWLPLVAVDAGSVGEIGTKGDVNVKYGLALP